MAARFRFNLSEASLDFKSLKSLAAEGWLFLFAIRYPLTKTLYRADAWVCKLCGGPGNSRFGLHGHLPGIPVGRTRPTHYPGKRVPPVLEPV
jgi:hypothetical protein